MTLPAILMRGRGEDRPGSHVRTDARGHAEVPARIQRAAVGSEGLHFPQAPWGRRCGRPTDRGLRREDLEDTPITGLAADAPEAGGGLEACRSERRGTGRAGDEVRETGSLGAVREDARGRAWWWKCCPDMPRPQGLRSWKS